MSRKGQTAMENLLVIIIIIVSVSIISGGVILNNDLIWGMYEIRVQAQELAFNLTIINDTTTYIIRIDDSIIDSDLGEEEIRIYMISENCTLANQSFGNEFDNLNTSIRLCYDLYEFDLF